MKEKRVCSVEGCEEKHVSHGFCRKHNAHAIRNNLITSNRKCGVEYCNSNHYAKGYCCLHYDQINVNGYILEKRIDVCIMEGCMAPVKSRKYCALHYGGMTINLNKIRHRVPILTEITDKTDYREGIKVYK